MFGGLVDKRFLSDISVYDAGTFKKKKNYCLDFLAKFHISGTVIEIETQSCLLLYGISG